MERFINPENESEMVGLKLSTMRHPSLDNTSPPMTATMLRFYRGPLPSNSSNPDNVYNFYANRNFKSQRVLQPDLSGSL
jgi:hypothetical protein